MKKLILTALALGASLPLLAQNFPLEITGSFNGWGGNTGTGPALTDMGGGIYEVTLTGLTAGRNTFKITQGDWGWYRPTVTSDADGWFIPDGNGNATISIDFNTHNDGWFLSQYRISTSVDPGLTWYAAGDFNGWNPTDPNTLMTPIGGGIYELQYTIASPGSYQFKTTSAGAFGPWDQQVGSTGRSINADTLGFTTTFANQQVDMFVNAINGTISVAVPEPTTAALLGLGGLLAIQRIVRRRK